MREIRLIQQMSGPRMDGRPWPAVAAHGGGTLLVGDEEAADLVRAGVAEVVATLPPPAPPAPEPVAEPEPEPEPEPEAAPPDEPPADEPAEEAGGDTADVTAIRQWAREQGFQVADQGRVPNKVMDAWRAWHGG